MTTIAIIYASGVAFFLTQAALYAKVSRQRIIGALIWPLIVLVLPSIIRAYREGRRQMEATLRFDERMGLKSICIGDLWGVGR